MTGKKTATLKLVNDSPMEMIQRVGIIDKRDSIDIEIYTPTPIALPVAGTKVS